MLVSTHALAHFLIIHILSMKLQGETVLLPLTASLVKLFHCVFNQYFPQLRVYFSFALIYVSYFLWFWAPQSHECFQLFIMTLCYLQVSRRCRQRWWPAWVQRSGWLSEQDLQERRPRRSVQRIRCIRPGYHHLPSLLLRLLRHSQGHASRPQEGWFPSLLGYRSGKLVTPYVAGPYGAKA